MNNPDIPFMFHPRSVAVVGVSKASASKEDRFGRASGLVGIIKKVGFEGKIYPVGPGVDEVLGIKAYPNIKDVPKPVDLVVVSVSYKNVIPVLKDCLKAGIKNVHVFASGFRETGRQEGILLERELIAVAEQGRMNLVGPNCTGLYLPHVHFSSSSMISCKKGAVSFLSQSGGHALNFVGHCSLNRIGLSKVISYGNGAVLDSIDFLYYLGRDPETEVIIIYIEGTGEGKRFYELVKEINPLKPIILWKGGQTQSGARAAASHTGSLGGNQKIWQALARQTKVMNADSLQEVIDLVRTVLILKPLSENRIGLLASGGGQSVAAADIVNREDLELPVFSQQKQNAVYDIITRVNTSAKNPVDIGTGGIRFDVYEKTLQEMMDDPSCDLIMVDPQFEFVRQLSSTYYERLVDLFCQMDRPKPMVVVLDGWEGNLATQEQINKSQIKLSQAGVMTYRSLPRACRALSRFIGYHRGMTN